MTKLNPWGRDLSEPVTEASQPAKINPWGRHDPAPGDTAAGRTFREVVENGAREARQRVVEAEKQREAKIKTEITAQYRRIEGCSEGTAQGLTESLTQRLAEQYPSGYVSFLEGQLLHLSATSAKRTSGGTTRQTRASEGRRVSGR